MGFPLSWKLTKWKVLMIRDNCRVSSKTQGKREKYKVNGNACIYSTRVNQNGDDEIESK